MKTGDWPGKSRYFSVTGMAAGTGIMTAEGVIPVEFVEPGERIITRSGMRILREKQQSLHSGRAIQIASGALQQGGPGHDLILLEDTMVFMRGMVALASDQRRSLQPLVTLLGDRHVLPIAVLAMPMFELCFDSEEVAYLDGIGVLCPAVSAPRAGIR